MKHKTHRRYLKLTFYLLRYLLYRFHSQKSTIFLIFHLYFSNPLYTSQILFSSTFPPSYALGPPQEKAAAIVNFPARYSSGLSPGYDTMYKSFILRQPLLSLHDFFFVSSNAAALNRGRPCVTLYFHHFCRFERNFCISSCSISPYIPS